MGRKLITGENQSIHPILSLSLLIACMAAAVALILSLCVSRKKPMQTASQPKRTEDLDVITASPNEATTIIETTTKEATREPPLVESGNTKEPQLPLPPPPGMPRLNGATSYHYRSSSSASSSERKLFSSLSVRVQGLGEMRQLSRREDTPSNDKKRDKKILKHEDSIWKKKIILGERCRVPDEDDTVVIDEKGNRISTYHPKTPSSVPVSRQTSFIDPDAIPRSG